MTTPTPSAALLEAATKLLASLPTGAPITLDEFRQHLRTQTAGQAVEPPADHATLTDQLERVLTDPDELDLYLGDLQELLGDRPGPGEAFSEGRHDQVLEGGLGVLQDDELSYLAVNPQQLLDLRLGLEETFPEHWSAVVGRLMTEYDRQDGIERLPARRFIANVLRKAGLGQYVADDPHEALTDPSNPSASGDTYSRAKAEKQPAFPFPAISTTEGWEGVTEVLAGVGLRGPSGTRMMAADARLHREGQIQTEYGILWWRSEFSGSGPITIHFGSEQVGLTGCRLRLVPGGREWEVPLYRVASDQVGGRVEISGKERESIACDAALILVEVQTGRSSENEA